MDKLLPELEKVRLKIFNDVVILENYKVLCEISEDCIIVDNYWISGEKLKITALNQFIIEINGKIKEIIIK